MRQFFLFSIIGLGILFNCMQGEEIKNARALVFSLKDSFLEQEKSNQQNISAIQLFGQRCSGTNYLQTLLTRNVREVSLDYRYGWKHYPCWHDTSWKEAYKMHFNPYYLDLIDSEHYLFIFIVRNPYEWAYSFYNHPHNVSCRVDRSSFSSFLSSTWYTEHEHKMQEILENNRVGPEGVQFRNDWISVYFSKPEAHQGLSTGFWDLEPTGLSYFKNVLALRTARLENFLKIAEKVGNVCIIKYEMLRDHIL